MDSSSFVTDLMNASVSKEEVTTMCRNREKATFCDVHHRCLAG